MKQIIKEFLQKYTDPKVKYSGISADELAKLLESELRVVRLKESLEDAKEVLNKKQKLNCKLGGIDNSIAEALGFKVKKIRPFNPEIIDEEMERVQDEEFRYGEEREREEFEAHL